MTFHRYKRSRIHQLGMGFWYCAEDGNGPALRDAPHRVNGVWLNTPRGLFGVTVDRKPRP